MNYIDSLPKELRNLLDYYKNYPYWNAFNELLKNHYCQSTTTDNLSSLLKEKFSGPLDALNIKYSENFERLQGNINKWYEAYYQVPETQIITVDILVKYINEEPIINPYRIACINKVLKDSYCIMQIVTHLTLSEKRPYSYTERYIAVDIN